MLIDAEYLYTAYRQAHDSRDKVSGVAVYFGRPHPYHQD